MAAKQMCGQLLDCDLGMAFQEQLSSDEITSQRREVFRNVAGHWAVEGIALPDTLKVPGILSYESVDELMREPPKTVCRDIYRGYTDLQENALATALDSVDPGSDIEGLLTDVTQGVLLESANRIDRYARIMDALGKPTDLLTGLLEDPPVLTVHNPQTVEDIIHTKTAKVIQKPDQQLKKLIQTSSHVTRMQINVERDVTMDVIAGQPISGAMLDLLKTNEGSWRQRLQAFFRKR